MSEANDTRPTVAAKAGDWVELRCGAVIGPLISNGSDANWPLLISQGEDRKTWQSDGCFLGMRRVSPLDIVAIVPRPKLTAQPLDDEPTACGLHPSGYAIERIIEHHSRNVAVALVNLLHVHVDNWDDETQIEEAVRLLGRELKRIEAARKAGG